MPLTSESARAEFGVTADSTLGERLPEYLSPLQKIFDECRYFSKMRGGTVQVPLAQTLSRSGAAPILGAELESRGVPLENMQFLGRGKDALVIGAGSVAVRIVEGEARDRDEDRNLLQAKSAGTIVAPGGKKFGFEILERILPVTDLEYDAFTARLNLEGKQYSDLAKNNIGRVSSGLILAIDPGGSFDTPLELFANRVIQTGRPDADNPRLIDQIVERARLAGFAPGNLMSTEEYLRILVSIVEARPELADALAHQQALFRAAFKTP